MNPNLVDKRLRPVLGEEMAEIVTALAVGAESTLENNPVVRYLLPQHSFLMFAVLYGDALRILDRKVSPGSEEKAAETKRLMLAIVEAMQVELPEESDGTDSVVANILARMRATQSQDRES